MPKHRDKFQILDHTLEAVRNEVADALNKHAPLNSLHEAHSVILEEVDEFWDAVKVNPKKLKDDDARNARRHNIETELVQIAAMCILTLMDVEI